MLIKLTKGPHIAAISGIEIIYNNSDKNWEDKKRVKNYKGILQLFVKNKH